MSKENACETYGENRIIRNMQKVLDLLKREKALAAACVIEYGQVVGEGWNSSVLNRPFPSGHPEFRVHAELNAILDAYQRGKSDLSNCVIYVTKIPCRYAYCSELLIQAKIQTVVYIGNDYEYPNETPPGNVLKYFEKVRTIPLEDETLSIAELRLK